MSEAVARTIRMDEVTFVRALTMLSTRWRLIPFDELTQLAFLLDNDQDGISYYRFLFNLETIY